MPKEREDVEESFPAKPSETDWAHVDALTDEVIDTSDILEPTLEAFARAIARCGLKPVSRKQQVTLRIDADVLAWFRAQGRGYQSRINALLREYMKVHDPDKR